MFWKKPQSKPDKVSLSFVVETDPLLLTAKVNWPTPPKEEDRALVCEQVASLVNAIQKGLTLPLILQAIGARGAEPDSQVMATTILNYLQEISPNADHSLGPVVSPTQVFAGRKQ